MTETFKNLWEKLRALFRMPEMNIFWIFIPFLVAIFVINAYFLPLFLKIATGGLVLIIAIIVFFYAGSLARSNQQIKIERSELRNIIFSLDDAVVAYDKNFKVLFFNPSAQKLFGLTPEVVLGKEITPQDVENYSRRLLAQVIFPSLSPVMISRSAAGTYPQVVDLSFQDPTLDLRVITNPILGEDGRAIGFLKIIRDRTRDIAILRSKNEFVTVASHQLRSPLTNIKWALETLTKDESLGEGNRELLKNALTANDQLLAIVEDLLMVAKIEEGRFGYNFQSLDLVDFINGILSAVLPQTRNMGIKLYFDRPQGKLAPVIADSEKLTMVIENLLDNAIRYNVKNGEVIVKVAGKEGTPFLEVSVRDTGIGISLDDMGKIFGKFFRAENAVKFKTEGSGLGLYIAKNIVRSHGGEMRVESEPSRGSTFHFTLSTDPALVPSKEVPLEY